MSPLSKSPRSDPSDTLPVLYTILYRCEFNSCILFCIDVSSIRVNYLYTCKFNSPRPPERAQPQPHAMRAPPPPPLCPGPRL